MEECCARCRFFATRSLDKNELDRRGSCRRRAPVSESTTLRDIGILLNDLHWKAFDGEETHQSGIVDFESQPDAVFPYVTGSDWCGEFERAEGA